MQYASSLVPGFALDEGTASYAVAHKHADGTVDRLDAFREVAVDLRFLPFLWLALEQTCCRIDRNGGRTSACGGSCILLEFISRSGDLHRIHRILRLAIDT